MPPSSPTPSATPPPVTGVGTALRDALHQIVRPPFGALTLITLFVAFVSSSMSRSASDFTLVASLLLFVISAYLNIAYILAAADPVPDASPDHWIKAAWLRRCFLRFFLADTFAILLVVAGLLVLVVPGFIVGGMVGLAPMAAVLELKQPGDAIRRSIDLTKPARGKIAAIFGGLVVAPNIALQVGYFLEVTDAWPWIILEMLSAFLFVLATLALVRLYFDLGGGREPVQERDNQERFTR